MKPDDFIPLVLPAALEVEKETGISSAAMVALAATETGWGDHVSEDMTTFETSNNYCNVKDTDTDDWVGPFVEIWTSEYLTARAVANLQRHGVTVRMITDYIYTDRNGNSTAHIHLVSRFRKYASIKESFSDFANVMQTRTRYATAWEARSDPEKFIREMIGAGYNTDPNATDTLISIIRAHF